MKKSVLRIALLTTLIAAGAPSFGSAASASNRAAVYAGLPADAFMKDWLILGPIAIAPDTAEPGVERQKQAFDDDLLAAAGGERNVQAVVGTSLHVGGREHVWRRIESTSDVIDLKAGATPGDFVVAYAAAEIELPQATKAVLGFGSDDGIKVWLNGKLVHENWTFRGARPDDDGVPVELVAGRNRLLLKIQNGSQGWGFACRRLGAEGMAKRLEAAVHAGDLKLVETILDCGANVHAPGQTGVTPVQVARLRGHREVEALLVQRGADVSAPLPPAAQLVDKLFNTLFPSDGAGAAVLVARDGQILFERGYGRANIEAEAAITPETQFRIGSVTKQFTAAAILKLAEEGHLSLEDKLAKFFPDYPRGDEVTLHHLLTHTSGIHSYTNKPEFIGTVTTPVEPAALIDSFKQDTYDFDPGQRWLYNNSGYFLLGEIVARASGRPYGDYLEETFFAPLGMTATGVHRPDAEIPHEATGYTYQGGHFEPALNWDMSRAGGAGALYSTVRDLFRWNEAIFNGKALSESSLAAAFEPVRTREDTEPGPKKTGYGYGWALAEFRGTRVIEHGGGLQGFVSQLLRLPEQKFTVVVLVNSAAPPPGVNPGALSRDVAEMFLGAELAPRPAAIPAAEVATSSLEAIVGRYDYGGGILTVTREDDRMFAQLTGQPRFEIFPRTEDTFFWKVVEAEVTFVRDEQGRVTKAVHRQGGQTINAPRLAEVAAAKVDPAIFDAYVGRYDYSGGTGQAILTVTREGDQLFTQLTGQPKFEIFPSSESEFFWKIVNAQVTFVRDADGKVVKAIHRQAGGTIEAPRVE